MGIMLRDIIDSEVISDEVTEDKDIAREIKLKAKDILVRFLGSLNRRLVLNSIDFKRIIEDDDLGLIPIFFGRIMRSKEFEQLLRDDGTIPELGIEVSARVNSYFPSDAQGRTTERVFYMTTLRIYYKDNRKHLEQVIDEIRRPIKTMILKADSLLSNSEVGKNVIPLVSAYKMPFFPVYGDDAIGDIFDTRKLSKKLKVIKLESHSMQRVRWSRRRRKTNLGDSLTWIFYLDVGFIRAVKFGEKGIVHLTDKEEKEALIKLI